MKNMGTFQMQNCPPFLNSQCTIQITSFGALNSSFSLLNLEPPGTCERIQCVLTCFTTTVPKFPAWFLSNQAFCQSSKESQIECKEKVTILCMLRNGGADWETL